MKFSSAGAVNAAASGLRAKQSVAPGRRFGGAQARVVLMILVCGSCLSCVGIRPPRGVAGREEVLETTGYCKCGECCGWKRNWFGRPVIAAGPNKGVPKSVGITASGERARIGTIAADTRRYPFGTIMLIPGYGYGRVEDRGRDIVGKHIDLYFHSHAAAQEWGKKYLKVKVWKPAQVANSP